MKVALLTLFLFASPVLSQTSEWVEGKEGKCQTQTLKKTEPQKNLTTTTVVKYCGKGVFRESWWIKVTAETKTYDLDTTYVDDLELVKEPFWIYHAIWKKSGTLNSKETKITTPFSPSMVPDYVRIFFDSDDAKNAPELVQRAREVWENKKMQKEVADARRGIK